MRSKIAKLRIVDTEAILCECGEVLQADGVNVAPLIRHEGEYYCQNCYIGYYNSLEQYAWRAKDETYLLQWKALGKFYLMRWEEFPPELPAWDLYISNDHGRAEIKVCGENIILEHEGGWEDYAYAVDFCGRRTDTFCDDYQQPLSLWQGKKIYDWKKWGDKEQARRIEALISKQRKDTE